MARRREPPDYLAMLMGGVGSLHFVLPRFMEKQMPPKLPCKRQLVYVSGVIEVGCAVGLVRREPWAGRLAAATLLGIWPANIQMALDAGTGRNPGRLMNSKALLWGRVPLQLPMVWAALQAKPK